uniref:Uncharacterized protein n=1 Tax=Sphaerodactylus townsendi TaxID=933632 RepID=A0ACB8FPV7_9SAUR
MQEIARSLARCLPSSCTAPPAARTLPYSCCAKALQLLRHRSCHCASHLQLLSSTSGGQEADDRGVLLFLLLGRTMRLGMTGLAEVLANVPVAR